MCWLTLRKWPSTQRRRISDRSVGHQVNTNRDFAFLVVLVEGHANSGKEGLRHVLQRTAFRQDGLTTWVTPPSNMRVKKQIIAAKAPIAFDLCTINVSTFPVGVQIFKRCPTIYQTQLSNKRNGVHGWLCQDCAMRSVRSVHLMLFSTETTIVIAHHSSRRCETYQCQIRHHKHL